MDDQDRQLLRLNRVDLVRNLQVSEDLLSFLISKRIINEDMKEEITEVHRTRNAKAGALLDMLPRRGPHAFRAFVEGLVESDQGSISDLLDKGTADKYRDQSGRLRDTGYPEGPPSQVLVQGPGILAPPDLNTDATFLDASKMREARPKLVEEVLDNNDDCYPMTGCPRGKAIILNIEKFQGDKHTERQGSNIDVVNITETFKKLGFTVDLWKDLSRQDLRSKVEEEQRNPDHKKYSAFLMFMLSHGSKGLIYTSDNAEIAIDELISKFDGIHCPALAGKPKMFFIQACQGNKKPEGVQADGDEEDLNDDDLFAQSMGTVDDADSVADVLKKVTHEQGDQLVAYSTVPGYKSWRHTSQGSWFIRDLVATFIKHAHKSHVLDIMTKLNRAIEKRAEDNKEGFRQICQFTMTMSRSVYFLPGYNTVLPPGK